MKLRSLGSVVVLVVIIVATSCGTVATKNPDVKSESQVVSRVILLQDGSARIVDGTMPEELVKHIPKSTVEVKRSYVIGAYHPTDADYNFKHYDEQKTTRFLAMVLEEYSDGDIISIDGLKWVKRQYAMNGDDMSGWEPFPNPPIPVYDPEKESVQIHTHEYAKWINDHPHFGYPPLPMQLPSEAEGAE